MMRCVASPPASSGWSRVLVGLWALVVVTCLCSPGANGAPCLAASSPRRAGMREKYTCAFMPMVTRIPNEAQRLVPQGVARRPQPMYMINSGSPGGKGPQGNEDNKDQLDELYYQRFMGVGGAESTLTDELSGDGSLDESSQAMEGRGGRGGEQEAAPSSSSRQQQASGLPVGAQGLLGTVKQAMPSFGGSDANMMAGPKVYIIPQNQGDAPLEVKSMAPDQRRGGPIGEIPGRKKSSGSRGGGGGGLLLDLPDKLPVESIKRAVKEIPRGFPEVQVQNMLGGGGANGSPRQSSSQQQKPREFSFPSFPAPSGSGRGGGAGIGRPQSSGYRRAVRQMDRDNDNMMDGKFGAMSRDWRTWVGLIAAVSFTIALFNSLSSRGELVVLNEGGPWDVNDLLRVSGLEEVGEETAQQLMV